MIGCGSRSWPLEVQQGKSIALSGNDREQPFNRDQQMEQFGPADPQRIVDSINRWPRKCPPRVPCTKAGEAYTGFAVAHTQHKGAPCKICPANIEVTLEGFQRATSVKPTTTASTRRGRIIPWLPARIAFRPPSIFRSKAWRCPNAKRAGQGKARAHSASIESFAGGSRRAASRRAAPRRHHSPTATPTDFNKPRARAAGKQASPLRGQGCPRRACAHRTRTRTPHTQLT